MDLLPSVSTGDTSALRRHRKHPLDTVGSVLLPASFPLIPSVVAGGGGQMTLAGDLAQVARFILDHCTPAISLSRFLDGHCHTRKYFLHGRHPPSSLLRDQTNL